MKKHVFFATFLFAIPFCVTAQEEVFPTGTVWKEVSEEVYYPEYPEYHTPMDTLMARVFEIGPDTVIGQKTYKQVFMDDTPWDCVIREEDGCVWMLADGYAEEFKLYDFNWDGRDTIVTQFLREHDRYAMWLAPEDDRFPLDSLKTEQGVQIVNAFYRIIIRNLGCVAELDRYHCLLGHRISEFGIPGLVYHRVLWIRKYGKEVYRYYGKNEWSTGIDELNGTLIPFANTSIYYDLQGRRVSPISSHPSPLKKGIYIENGRKRVVSH